MDPKNSVLKRATVILAVVFACLIFAVLAYISTFFLAKAMDEQKYVDRACLDDMRRFSASSENLLKYRTENMGSGRYRWVLEVGPVAHELWLVHEPTAPGVFAEFAGRRVVHIGAGKIASFVSSEFGESGNQRSSAFTSAYSYSLASEVDLAALKSGIHVVFPVLGNSEVMQTAQDGSMTNYIGFKDWPKSHEAPEAIQAVDIMAPQGTEIISASAGTVVEVSQGNRDLGCRSMYVGLTNRLIVLGNDGLQYKYAHIQKMSSFVKIGDKVRAGDKLALVGRSGGYSVPHLHFAVQTMLPRGTVVSVPIEFLPCTKGYRGGPARNGAVSCNL